MDTTVNPGNRGMDNRKILGGSRTKTGRLHMVDGSSTMGNGNRITNTIHAQGKDCPIKAPMERAGQGMGQGLDGN